MPHIDKVVHVTMFFLFTIASIVGFIKQFQIKWINRHACKFAIFFALALGIAVEFIQGAFVPLRAFDLMDMLANTAGVILGYCTYLIIKGKDDFHML
jgi:VanZ family protein